MEVLFKILLALAVLVFCVTIIGIFLLVLKVMLLFQTQVNIMGLIIS